MATRASGRQSGRAPASAMRAASTKARNGRRPAAAAAGGAVGGLALGVAVGARLRAHRRPHLLGMPLPRSRELSSSARNVMRAGRRLYALESDVRALRAQADTARRQSPIEVVLSALTSRRIPRRS